MMRYTVQRGDTLWDLARKHGTTVDELMRLNPHIQDRNKIYAGRAINLPDGPSQGSSQASGSSPTLVSSPEAATNPGDASASTPLVRPPLFPEAMANPQYPNPVQQDAAQAGQGMQTTPEALMAMGVGLGSKAVVEAIPALAKAMPKALPRAGQVASNATANVMPIQGSVGAARAMMNQPAPASLPEMLQWYLRQPAGPAKGPSFADLIGY